MAINETIVKGRKFRKLVDASNKIWQRISYWTAGADVEFESGDDAETTLGAVKGITSDVSTVTEAGYAADALAVKTLNNNLNLYVGDDGKLHWVDGSGADTALNFSSFKNLEMIMWITHSWSGDTHWVNSKIDYSKGIFEYVDSQNISTTHIKTEYVGNVMYVQFVAVTNGTFIVDGKMVTAKAKDVLIPSFYVISAPHYVMFVK